MIAMTGRICIRVVAGLGLALSVMLSACSGSSGESTSSETVAPVRGVDGSSKVVDTDPATSDLSSETSAGTESDAIDPEFLKSDYAQVEAVAHVRVDRPKIMDSIGGDNGTDDSAAGEVSGACGYAFVRAEVTFVEVFKGPFKKGDVKNVAWTIECPVNLANFFPGERVLFATRGETRFATDWYALENSTLGATNDVLAVLRSEAR